MRGIKIGLGLFCFVLAAGFLLSLVINFQAGRREYDTGAPVIINVVIAGALAIIGIFVLATRVPPKKKSLTQLKTREAKQAQREINLEARREERKAQKINYKFQKKIKSFQDPEGFEE